MVNLRPIKKITTLIIIGMLALNKINAQTLDFTLQSSPLTFDYSNLSHFQSTRTFTKAFTVNITNSKKNQYNIYCKIEPYSNSNFGLMPNNLFSVKLNSANFTIAGTSFLPKTLSLTNVLLLEVVGRSRKADILYFDLILNPLEFIYEPNFYNYNFIFTVSEN